MLWVPVRNQHLIRSSFPSSFDYESEMYPGTSKGPWNFVKQFGASPGSRSRQCQADAREPRPRRLDGHDR